MSAPCGSAASSASSSFCSSISSSAARLKSERCVIPISSALTGPGSGSVFSESPTPRAIFRAITRSSTLIHPHAKEEPWRSSLTTSLSKLPASKCFTAGTTWSQKNRAKSADDIVSSLTASHSSQMTLGMPADSNISAAAFAPYRRHTTAACGLPRSGGPSRTICAILWSEGIPSVSSRTSQPEPMAHHARQCTSPLVSCVSSSQGQLPASLR